MSEQLREEIARLEAEKARQQGHLNFVKSQNDPTNQQFINGQQNKIDGLKYEIKDLKSKL